jgi:NAD+ synthetase
VGVTICEDLWNNHQFDGRPVYVADPVELTFRAGATLLANLSASPYRAGVEPRREALFAAQMREHRTALVYVNQVGGNDDLVFDGASMVMDAAGRVVARAKAFEEDLLIAEIDPAAPASNFAGAPGRIEPQPDYLEGMRKALVLGTRDYVRKCGFHDVIVGLSGGIDSALTAALAVEALGAARVHGVALPSRYSSPQSLEDARHLAANLGIELRVISIENGHRAMEAALAESFTGRAPDVAEENIQSRIRGLLLMALANKFGWMLLTTGNKSELAVGYCTLYGDMCGGLAMLSDVPKTTVYELSRRINAVAGCEVIPRRTIDRVPTAELRPHQTDQDTLPPYEVLDAILQHHLDGERSAGEIIQMGFDRPTVERVVGMVRAGEHKRKQSPVGLKVSGRAFGTGRRYPIASRYI